MECEPSRGAAQHRGHYLSSRQLCLCVGGTWGPSCLLGDPNTLTSSNSPAPGKGSWRFEHAQSHRYTQIRGNAHNDTQLPFQAQRVQYRA